MCTATMEGAVQIVNYASVGTSRAWAMLTARALQYDGSRGGHGGLRQSDIAAMLGGLDRRYFLAGLFLEAGDWTSLIPLERKLFHEVVDLAWIKGWDLRTDGLKHCRSLGHLALYEAAGPATICPKCDGEGATIPPGEVMPVQCKRCDGKRKLPLTPKSRAELISISDGNWYKVWCMRYEHVVTALDYWLAEANRHLKRQLNACGNEIRPTAQVA